jgi:hypothetical protein
MFGRITSMPVSGGHFQNSPLCGLSHIPIPPVFCLLSLENNAMLLLKKDQKQGTGK